ncbi:MAG: hypothetical protein J1F67_05545 [Muribaculaceae bacterium]|nr:hypothetical protein [Muribaculaceae bacterium]
MVRISNFIGVLLVAIVGPLNLWGKAPKVAYDLEMAKEICAGLPLENVEGIWLYPDDNVTVMILNDNEYSGSQLPSYSISVVETSDARLHPGEIIGKLNATVDSYAYKIELSTEKKNDLLLKPKSCIATLSKDGDTFIIKKQKAPFKGRLNFNLNRLLPGFWKIVSIGVSQNNYSNSIQHSVGMVKIFPSYDGNGSSRRKIRYL